MSVHDHRRPGLIMVIKERRAVVDMLINCASKLPYLAPPAELSHILEVYDIHDSESADGIHAAIPHEVRVKHLSATSLLLIFPSAHAAKVHASEHATKQHQSGSLEAKYKLRTWRPHIQG